MQPSALVHVINPDLLGRLLREEIRRRNSTQSRAAAQLALSQPHVSRLCSGRSKNVRVSTLKRLRRFLPADQWPALWNSVLTPSAKGIFDDYFDWLERQLAPYGKRPVHPAVEGTSLLEAGGRYPPLDSRRAVHLVRLRTHRSYRSFFVAFEQQARARGHGPARVELALLRAVEPLLASVETYGLERGWEELDSSGELKSYLNAALTRERILLNRSPDMDRLRALTDGD